eukprot:TRINITY_DN7431_c0_g4_i1.p1 TRINITY_DN7431_c0_g4~~TRINITY_DN7431_c0_g4_i1.p1  ORF type:complete len:298 (-),score=82.56 TRINITY_DN7431_c0_g4_i1:55-948(-)
MEAKEPEGEIKPPAPEIGEPLLSKRQRKRNDNKEKWTKMKDEKKKKKKAERKAKQQEIAKEKELKKAEKLLEEEKKEDEKEHKERGPLLSTKDKKKLFREKMLQGTRIIIDCSFQNLLTEKELNSLSRQICHCYASNRKVETPSCLTVSSYSAGVKANLSKTSAERWDIEFLEKDYIEYYDKDKLIYLSGDAEETLQEVDPTKIYIIGGLVDHNRIKKGTYNKAVEQGIKIAKLPLSENIKLEASPILAVNHVFDIILRRLNGDDWKTALERSIPKRKKHKGETNDSVVSEEVAIAD